MNAQLTHYRKVSEPGSKEHWEITLTDGEGKALQQAEMLAWMIDGSLYELGMRKADYGQNYYPQKVKIPRKYAKKYYNIYFCRCTFYNITHF